MARICVHAKWYEQVEPSTFTEEEFESRVALHAPSVYPYYNVVRFKKTVKAPDESSANGYAQVIPDLALIAKDYSEWWVSEVEMGYHSFKQHVKPQVIKLINAEYGDEEGNYLCDKYTFLDREAFRKLWRLSAPRILLIVNQPKPLWKIPLASGHVPLAIFELFRSDDECEIFRVNGEYPSSTTDVVSKCSFHPVIPRLIKVDNPDKLGVPRRGIVKLLFNSCVTEWRRIDEGDEVWLTALSRNPLQENYSYTIYRLNSGQLVLQKDITA